MNVRNKEKLTTTAEIVVPLLIMVVGTLFCLFTDFDLELSKRYFDPIKDDWPARHQPLVDLSYHWGTGFSGIVAFWALFHLFASYIHPRFLVKRGIALFLLLSILIGPVLLVNGAKDTWRRPRPRETVELGGSHPYRKVLEISHRRFRGKSFPGGHASAGFILVMFYFLFKPKGRKWAGLALLFGIGWGTWLSYVRIVLGGHFFSDNLYAFGLNWFLVWFLYYKWYLPYQEKHRDRPRFLPSRRRYVVGISSLLLGSMLLALPFLISKPYRIDYPDRIIDLRAKPETLTIKVRAEKGDIIVLHGQPGQIAIRTWISGQALPDIQAEREMTVTEESDQWQINYTVSPSTPFFLEYQSHTAVYVPKDLNVNWDLFTQLGEVMRDDLKVKR
ncbi:MAG: phosphatase PAP2 family protein [Deltaproteobacteria bacterium]|nr:phosphatase PAP2 family protein [Deltaproteobacteria bacterium]MBT4644807.1 phosphatase PAP2 family protein [Deltaproteobacteria bacterium]MBT6501345.1 phosphatase PAP2 family protein [Deltaproteobacteria bacterium]MBT6612863.1 phosphatase PAP2 family protein [Deltaproteobacteria bacterium]MBT7153994.1 phosphatase PAP2 family protein [Deltaproteobacteria bacterium]